MIRSHKLIKNIEEGWRDGSGNIVEEGATELYEPGDQRVAMRLCLLVLSETTPTKFYQHDCLNMS